MKMLIDIDENLIKDAINGYRRLDEIVDVVIKTGKPLPRGCDKLVDASKLEYFRCDDNKCDSAYDVKCQTCEYSIVHKYQIDNAYINL